LTAALSVLLLSMVRAMAYDVDFEATQPDPDLVCLTEVAPAFAKQFERRFARRYPFLRFAPARGTWGLGLASRHSITRAHVRAAVAPHARWREWLACSRLAAPGCREGPPLCSLALCA
jgi:hypothetical protein